MFKTIIVLKLNILLRQAHLQLNVYDYTAMGLYVPMTDLKHTM